MTKQCVSKIYVVAAVLTLALASLASISAGEAFAWNFSVPAQEVKPVNGVFAFPASAFEDGKARYFEYRPSPTQRIRFFVVKSTDGVIRAAFDACEVCWKAKKGYVQQGTNMVCVNCGLKFRTDKVNEVTGGCNPSALNRVMKDGQVLITAQDALQGQKYFQ